MPNIYLILLVTLLTEATLGLIWIFAVYFKLITPASELYSASASVAVIFSTLIPLLLFNYLLFIRFPSVKRKLFLESTVYPLCQILSWQSAIIISVLAGIGEELFFRDFLLNLIISSYENKALGIIIGILISSLAFSLVHFIRNFKENWELVLIYFIVGVYFGSIYILTNSIVICIVVHALYDLIAIQVYKYLINNKH